MCSRPRLLERARLDLDRTAALSFESIGAKAFTGSRTLSAPAAWTRAAPIAINAVVGAFGLTLACLRRVCSASEA